MRITLDFRSYDTLKAFMDDCRARKNPPLYAALFTGEAYQGPAVNRINLPYNEGGMMAMNLAATTYTPVQITIE